jgi:predicted Ser/Thr protein kinase
VEPAHTTSEPLTSLGDFRIHGVLGAGGSGTVYDASWGPRRVALKVLHAALSGTGPFTHRERTQFLAEAQRLQQIGHPSVVKVLAVGELPDGRPYLAMERLDGETLAAVISRGALSLELAFGVFGELCGAVAALHDQGLVHRDLKPENIYIVNQRHAVLLDFGIAKDLAAPASTTTQEGNVRGTPAYMAPERFFGQPAGLATDIYELALVLYAMLAGRLPWLDAADPDARLSPVPLTEVAEVPEALDIEIRRALSTRAQNRPASADALLSAVRAAAGITRPEPGPGETAPMRSASLRSAEVEARGPTLDAKRSGQVTRLGRAPTVAAPSIRTARRKRWSWIAAAGTVVAASSIVIYARVAPHPAAVGEHERARIVAQVPADARGEGLIAEPNDPWSARPVPAPKQLPLVAAASPRAAYRAAARAAISHLPGDTKVVISVQLDELHDNTATADMMHKLATNPKVDVVLSGLPECIRTLAGTSEWLVFGAPGLETKQTGALIVGGRWQRSDVEACFDATPVEVKDGSQVYKVGDLGWLDFIDDHTAYLAMRPSLDAEHVHALARRGGGVEASTRSLLAKLPVDHSIAFAISSRAKVNWASMLLLPNSSDVVGWARVNDKGMELDIGAETHDPKAASAAAAVIRPQLQDVFSSSDGAGKLVVALDGSEVRVRGSLTTFTLSMISGQIDR